MNWKYALGMILTIIGWNIVKNSEGFEETIGLFLVNASPILIVFSGKKEADNV